MKKYLLIKADTNDGDYISEKTEITDKEIEDIKPIIKAIEKCKHSYNWPNSENCDETVEEVYKGILTEEQIESFQGYVPLGEDAIHSIEEIEVIQVLEKLL